MTKINNSTIYSKFSFFEHITPTKSFSWKIALFNTTVFCLIAIIDTGGSRLCEKPFHCPWGYWVLLAAIPLALGNYWLSISMERWLYQILSPYIFTVIVCWLVSLFNFHQPVPNLWWMLTFACIPSIGLLAAVIRYYIPRVQSKIGWTEVDVDAKISWVKENSNTWRTLGLWIIASIVTCVIFWCPFILKQISSTKYTYTEQQQGYFIALWAIVATDVVSYVILGPAYECFRKAEHIMNMLLDIKKDEAK
ncbi:MAG: hypothetical protein WC770_04390 [Phycisphaerae bacterium]|jgi:hypothetical protein